MAHKIDIKIDPNTLSIIEEPRIKENLQILFSTFDTAITDKINEILNFIKFHNEKIYKDLSFDNIYENFKLYFYKKIINEAINTTLSCVDKYDFLENILELINSQIINEAILGETMINSFNRAIRRLPNENVSGLQFISKGSLIILLEKEFLGIVQAYI